jgi:tRNA (guanine-N7-)-methyltransferase
MSTVDAPDGPASHERIVPQGAPTAPAALRPAAPAKPSLIYNPESFFQSLKMEELFASGPALEVELGSGDGSFLVQYARACPDRNFLGVERLLGRLRKIDRKGQRAGLTNLRAMRIEASYFLEYLLPPASVAALHVYFPDPWPKRKHRKNRLISPRFAELAARVLLPRGVVYLRTDDADYFAQMRTVFDAAPGFSSIETPPALAAIVTDFEREFLARGVRTLAAAYQRG